MEDRLNDKLNSADDDLQKQAFLSIEQQEEMLLTRLNIERQKLEAQIIT
jgi:hypothetical protein